MAKEIKLEAVLRLKDEFSKQLSSIKAAIHSVEKSLKQSGSAAKPLADSLKNVKDQLRNIEQAAHDSFNHAAEAGKHSAAVMRDAWLKTVAKVTAAFYVLREGLDLAQETARAEQAMQALAITVKAKGQDIEKVFEEIKEASGGLVSNADLVQSANQAIALGIDIDKIGKLMEIARYRARLFGTDVSQAFQDITTGIGRMSPLILDNLGITIKLTEAYQEYAKEHGKTIDQLTAEEQKRAVLNAVMKQSEGLVKEFSKTGETAAEKFQRLQATFKNMREELGARLIPIYTALAEMMIKVVPYIEKSIYGWKMLWATIKVGFRELEILWYWAQSHFSSSWEDISNMLVHAAKKGKEEWRKTIQELKQEMDNAKFGEIDWEEMLTVNGKPLDIPVRPKLDKPEISPDALDALKQIQDAVFEATAPDIEKEKRKWDQWAQQQLELARKAGLNTALLQIELEEIATKKKAEIDEKYRKEKLQKDIEMQSRLADMTFSFMQQQLDFAKQHGQIDPTTYLTEKLELLKEKIKVLKWQLEHAMDPAQAEMLAERIATVNGELAVTTGELERIGRTSEQGLKDGLKRAINEIKPLADQMEDLMVNTAQSMEQAFSDFFFDAMTGKLKSLDDYFRSFSQSVMRYIADIMAKMMALQLLKGVGDAFNIKFPFPTAHTGGLVVPGGIQKFHDGGLVGLRSDEVPAVLQVGEVVLSRNQVQQLANGGGGSNVVINVKNETGMPMNFDVVGMKKQREAEIIDVVVKQAQIDPNFRAMLGGR